MSPLRTSLLIAILATLSACGRQVVDFKLGEDAGIDARVDGSTDAPTDASTDAPLDAPIDGPIAIRPTVTSTIPSPGAFAVALTTTVRATFSKPMNPATLTMATFTLRQGATVIPGSVMLDGAGTTATFTPMGALTGGLLYTARITTGAQDTGGLGLAVDYTWVFTTAVSAAPPTVLASTPFPGATNVSINVSPTATFSKAMNPATISMATFTLMQGATPIPGTVMLDGLTNTATFDPTNPLVGGLTYTAMITTGAQDTGGLALAANYTWTFTTGSLLLPPTVTTTTPLPGAFNVSINISPTATFSKAMNVATINMTTFTLMQGATPIMGTVMLDALTNTATFDPASPLTAGLVYTARITTGAQDTGGLALALDYTWTFTPGSTCVVAPVALGTAGNFAVLAGSTVTNTGPTMVTGDLGVFSGTAVTGFPPGILIGTQFAGVPTAGTAQGDLTIAYNDAAGRTLCAVTVAGNLGGMTLPPGLYKSTSFLEISSGDLTLDAQGDPNAVWVFQMAATLTTTIGRQVVITGGGSAANVYWQVGSSATIGTGSAFKGTIMADQAITLNAGATLDGRALARIAAVTLDSSTVTRP